MCIRDRTKPVTESSRETESETEDIKETESSKETESIKESETETETISQTESETTSQYTFVENETNASSINTGDRKMCIRDRSNMLFPGRYLYACRLPVKAGRCSACREKGLYQES